MADQILQFAYIFGGLGLFIFGVTYLGVNLRLLADGRQFRKAMNKATDNRFKAFGIGTGFTAIIQSSGGTSALSIGLVKAGALEYKSAIAVIIGANVGTCITAFLISIPSLTLFMPFVACISALIIMLVKNRKWQMGGKLAFAFSLIFFGILLMEKNVKNLVEGKTWFENLMIFMNGHPWVGLLFGTAVTLVLQSSSAVIGIVQSIFLAAVLSGHNYLFGFLPLIFGSNIGAVIPSILSAFNGPQVGKRVAFLNTLMKVTTALLFMGIIYACRTPIENMTFNKENAMFSIAIAHLIFNIVETIIFLPLLDPLCKLGEVVFKDKNKNEKIGFKELDTQVLKEFPSTGISLAKGLSNRMFYYVQCMYKEIKDYFADSSEERKDRILELEATVDGIDRHLADFLLHAEAPRLAYADQVKYNQTLRAIKDIERIGDYGETLLGFFENMNNKKEHLDAVQKKEIYRANDAAINLITKTMDVYRKSDKHEALIVIQERRDLIKELGGFTEAYFDREAKKKGDTATYLSLVYVDILNSYERVYAHCSNIAKLFNTDKQLSSYKKSDDRIFKEMSSRY